MKFVCMNWFLTFSTTPRTSGSNSLLTPLSLDNLLGDQNGGGRRWVSGRLGKHRFCGADQRNCDEGSQQMASGHKARGETGDHRRTPFCRLKRSRPLDDTHPGRTGNDSSPREADEQAVFHDARDCRQPRREGLRVGDALQLRVDEPVPAIRDESMAVLRLRSGAGPGQPTSAATISIARRVTVAPNGTISIGSGKRPSVLTHFDSSAITIILADAAATIFSRKQRPAAALDQVQIRRDLVGAVDGQVQFGRLVERGQCDAEPLCLHARGLRRRNGRYFEPGPNALAQQLDKVAGGRAGAEPKPHARLHERDGTARRRRVSALRHPCGTRDGPR